LKNEFLGKNILGKSAPPFDQPQRDGEKEREGERSHFIHNKNAAEGNGDMKEDLQHSNTHK
jgi:hypothetical protein